MQEAWSIAISSAVSAAVSAAVGLAIKSSIGRKLDEARDAAFEQKRRRVQYTKLRGEWMCAAGRVLYHLVRIAQGVKKANGDLGDSFARLEAAERGIKDQERQYAAEAQEE